MTNNVDRLYDLLPLVYRQRDQAEGYPLKALLRVIGEQVQVIEDDITQLYENWFIETCEDWVVPYLGDLVGYRPVFEGEGPDVTNPDRQKILIPRREVADTIRFRRRKGTLALLEELAFSTAGWPARVVEFYPLLAQTQALSRLRPERGRTVDLRNSQALRDLNTPFEQVAHTIDVRRITPQTDFKRGFFNVPNVGVFVWRMKSYSITEAPAFTWDRRAHHYTFSCLSNDTQLYVNPRREENPTTIAGPHNLPVPIPRADFAARMADYYGPNKSFQIFTGYKSLCKEKKSSSAKEQISIRPIPIDQIIAADLKDWEHYSPEDDQILVDPERGRMVVGSNLMGEGIWVTYHYGFAADLGGGEYNRPLPRQADYQISKYELIYHPGQANQQRLCIGPNERPINTVLQRWKADGSQDVIIEIIDNEEYVEPIILDLAENQRLTLRAANGKRPLIRLLDYHGNRVDELIIRGATGSRCTLDGLLIEGRPVNVEGDIATVNIRHCTLVPGWNLDHDCSPKNSDEMSLILTPKGAMTVTIERSIIGSIQVAQNEVWTDPSRIIISDSVLDATKTHYEALSAGECRHAHALLTIKNSTVFGEIHTHAIELAENSIFIGWVRVVRRQIGCMRFCYVDNYNPESRTPRRFNCQPELAMQGRVREIRRENQQAAEADQLSEDELIEKIRQEARWLEPKFKSTTFGTTTYAQLGEHCATEITQGADDESEMGVYHHLYTPQRLANLETRLKEFTPADMEVGIILVT